MTQLQPTDEMIRAAQAATCDIEADGCMRDAVAAVLAIVERDQVEPLRTALDNLVDPDPCGHYDHHGNCQAHMATARGRCAHAVAKELLAAPAPEAGAGHHTQDAREAQCGNCGHLVLPDGSCACSWPIDAARPAAEPTEEP